MDVSAQTLREVEFREKLRGYHPDDVDEFLERVAAGIEYLQDRLRQATERAQRAEQRADESTESDDALKRTLVLAQRTAEMAVSEARQEADRIASSARAEAKAIVAQAEEMARRTIEETQGGIRGELSQLEAARDRLRADITALEHHLAQERERIRDSLSKALHAVEDHLAPAADAPAPRDVAIPPMRVPKVPAMTPPDAETVAAFAAPAPASTAPAEPVVQIPDTHEPEPAEPEPFEIEIVHTVPEGTVAEAPVAPAVFDELAVEVDGEPEPVAAPEAVPAPTPRPPRDEVAASASPFAPVDEAPAVREAPAPEDEDEDPFIAELRRAITDTQPLGPREEGDTSSSAHDDELMHGDVLDSSRLGSLLRRRR